MSERRRAGALVVPKARPPADRSLLQTPATGDHQSDSWRVLRFISEFVKVPVALVGVGPGREEVIWTQAGMAMAGGAGRADDSHVADAVAAM